MKNNEQSATIELLTSNATTAGTHQPAYDEFYIEAALRMADPWQNKYDQVHLPFDSCEFPDAELKLLKSFFQWQFNKGCRKLEGIISANDFLALCDVLTGDIATPHDTEFMATTVADEYGLEQSNYAWHPVAPLLNKLICMDDEQKFALRILAQRFWYQKKGETLRVKEFLEKNDVILEGAA